MKERIRSWMLRRARLALADAEFYRDAWYRHQKPSEIEAHERRIGRLERRVARRRAMATCEWCGGTGWGEARPKVGLADKWLRVPCPNPECAYRAEDPRDMLLDAAARYIALRADNGAETAGQAFAAEGVPGGGLLGPREWLRQWRELRGVKATAEMGRAMAIDPRVEAAARAMHAAMWRPIEVRWDYLEPEAQGRWLLWIVEGLAAADAVDPLRDREKLVPAIADALAGLGGDPDPDVWAQAAMAVFDAVDGGVVQHKRPHPHQRHEFLRITEDVARVLYDRFGDEVGSLGWAFEEDSFLDEWCEDARAILGMKESDDD